MDHDLVVSFKALYALTISAKYGDDISLQPFFDAVAWVEATRGPNKGRLYDFGSMMKAMFILGGSFASYSYMQSGSFSF
ncbi:hypothetical protein COCNU_14G006070 [Cocos nucifera]|uniref:Uncharacterized protein n=1 Tax=Cocos nucifera TaxID=13894 RepID=A0A8K0NC51_COCNU|nr:hypothetical protein COCNU_14G006070 [Cocos nucifera]